jgi:GNAT superfamily N-acetyltransferase
MEEPKQMNVAEIQYEQYSEKNFDAVKELVTSDGDVGEDILLALPKDPQLFITVHIEDKLVAMAQVNEPVSESYLKVFVAPQYRRQGIGSAVVRYAENKLRAGGTKKVRCSYRVNPSSLAFASKLGYVPYFQSAFMQRAGDPFLLEELPIRSYTDEDYLASHSLYATAFHEMRVRTGCFLDSVIARHSEMERIEWKEKASNRFVFELNGEIVAYSNLSGNKISSIAVHTDHQRLGIGRKFLMYLCNHIYQQGSTEVGLWCVVGNYARNLYESVGFNERYVEEYLRKTL